MLRHSLLRTRWLLASVLLALAAWASADIAYHVRVPADEARALVRIVAPVTEAETAFQIPRWTPGAYILGDYATGVNDVSAADAQGHQLPLEHPDDITWTVSTGSTSSVSFSYSVARWGDESGTQLAGPSTYMYVVGRKAEPCTIEFAVAEDWGLALGLDPVGARKYRAPNYDVLADAPVQMGEFREDVFKVRGVPHHIVTFGEGAAEVDRERLTKVCRQIVESETAFFGDIPYKRYYFLFHVFKGEDGGGGLEHLNSTSIGLASGLGPRAVHVIAHEFFHVWNVKRIRPFVLGPFDYTQAAVTRNLWFCEGVTEYYTRMLNYRGGLLSRDEFLTTLHRSIESLQDNPARLTVSADESSLRVWEVGNTQGYNLSYYLKGDLVGLCLDLKLRDLTEGKHSLDDVMRSLYEQCGRGNGPGFPEDGIRDTCIALGGPEMGPFYDRVVRSTEELPFTELLALFGVRCLIRQTEEVDIGGLLRVNEDEGGLVVRLVRRGGPLDKAGLQNWDVILAVDGMPVLGDEPDSAMQRFESNLVVGKTYTLKVRHEGEEREVPFTPAARGGAAVECTFVKDPLPRQKRMLEGWLSGK
jgi:predicted metalloprotease with PDZ domain